MSDLTSFIKSHLDQDIFDEVIASSQSNGPSWATLFVLATQLQMLRDIRSGRITSKQFWDAYKFGLEQDGKRIRCPDADKTISNPYFVAKYMSQKLGLEEATP